MVCYPFQDSLRRVVGDGMNRFFVPEAVLAQGSIIEITDSQDVQHIQKVLRMKVGETLEIADGSGSEAIGEITGLQKGSVTVAIIEECTINRESPVEIVLYQALPKGQKWEVILQKNTEIGVSAFVPVVTERCVVKLSDMASENKKRVRWQMIIDEAAKQSKRGKLPVLKPAISLKEALLTLEEFDLVLIPHTGDGTLPLATVLRDRGVKKVAVFIGPEGGFTDGESQAVIEAGGQSITLGPRILRTETAGFVACSILQYVFGDMGGFNS